jgi:hypothetical protein
MGSRVVVMALVMGSLVLGGCAGSMARKPNLSPAVSLKPMNYRILKTVEGTGEVTTILCLFKTGASQFGYSSVGGGSALGLSALVDARDAVAAATYEAISKVPEADMLLPLTTTAERSGLGCLFGTERATVRGKAIKILD